MASRKHDFMPSWLQSPSGDGPKSWKAGSGRDSSLHGSAADSQLPSYPLHPHEIRRMPSFPSQNDNIGGRRPQRALSFETAEQASAYSRPRGSGGFRRQPVRSSGDFSNGANNDTFNRAPRSHRPNDHAAWPRPESANPPGQGLERNFHQHFPSLRGAVSPGDRSSPHTPTGAWDARNAFASSSRPQNEFRHTFLHGRHLPLGVADSPTDEEPVSRRLPAKFQLRSDRVAATTASSTSTTVAGDTVAVDTPPPLRYSTAERSNMRLNLAIASNTQVDADKVVQSSRQNKAQSPNGGKVTLRSLSKSDLWKGQKQQQQQQQTEEAPTPPAPPVHSAIAPWSSQAPPPAPAAPRQSSAKTPDAPAVMLQRQIETKSKGTSESRLNFFKSLQHNSENGGGNEESSSGAPSASEGSSPMVDSLSSGCQNSTNGSIDEEIVSPAMDVPAPRNTAVVLESSTSQPRDGAIDRDHLTASFYDEVIDSGVITFDDSVDVNEEDLRVMKVWGWTPDAYDNVECITLGEVANFQAAFRSYVNKKLKSNFLESGSLGAQRLFRRHHQYLSIDSIPVAMSTDTSEGSSSSSSSDEERK